MTASIWTPSTGPAVQTPASSALISFRQRDWRLATTATIDETVEEELLIQKNLLSFCSLAKRTLILASRNTGTPVDVNLEFQALLDAVCPIYYVGALAGVARLPDGAWLLMDNVINACNNRVAGTLCRDGLVIYGKGVTILGNAGAGKPIIEITGSQRLHLSRGIRFSTNNAACTTPATIGILAMAPSTDGGSTQNQLIESEVNMHTNAAANGTAGTVAVWDFGAEEMTLGEIYTHADCGLILTSANDGTQPGGGGGFTPASLLANVPNTHTLGVTTLRGECFLAGWDCTKTQLIMQNVSGVKIDNLFIGSEQLTAIGANYPGVQLIGNTSASEMNIHMEGYSTFEIDGGLLTSKLKLIVGGVQTTVGHSFATYPAIGLNKTTNGEILLCPEIIVDRQNLNGIAAPGAPIIDTLDLDHATGTTAAIKDTHIWSYALGAANLDLTPTIAVNCSNVGLNGSYRGALADPTFTAGLTADTGAITGDGTIVALTLAWAGGGTFIRGGRFDATSGHFTAVVPGDYEFEVQVCLYGIAAGHTIAQLWLEHSAGAQLYLLDQQDPHATFVTIGGVNYYILKGRVIVPMTFGEYVLAVISVGGVAKAVGVKAGGSGSAPTPWATRFSGRSVRGV